MDRREFVTQTVAMAIALNIPVHPDLATEYADSTTDNLLVKCYERFRIPFGHGDGTVAYAEESKCYPNNEGRDIFITFKDGSRLRLPSPAAEILERIDIRMACRRPGSGP